MILRSIAGIALAALLLGLGCSSPALRGPEELREHAAGMNLLVVLFDAAAADHFSFLGYERETAPHLAALAEESIVFENAYAQAAATPLSVVSLFTGSYPIGTELPAFKGEIVPAIREDHPTLASVLASSHPSRAAFSANRWVCRELGYDQGFNEFEELWAGPDGEIARPVVPASYLSDQLLGFLDGAPEEPFFVYAHYLEPHLPYTPPEPFASLFDPEIRGQVECTTEGLKPYRASRPPTNVRKEVVALYDGNLAYADDQFGRVVKRLKQKGLWDRTVVVFLSDHGEAFWQHNWRGHGSKVYEEFVRVPLLLRVPGLAPGRIEDVVELVDLYPTLVDLFGLETEAALAGQSWLPRIFAEGPAPEVAQLAFFRNHETRMTTAIREGRYKAVRQRRENKAIELFDLLEDPREETNLQSHRNPETREATQELSTRLAERLHHILESGEDSPLSAAGADSLSPEAIEQLRAIGYFN